MIQAKQNNFPVFLHIGGIFPNQLWYFPLCLVQFLFSLVSAFERNNPMVGMTVSVAVAVEESLKK